MIALVGLWIPALINLAGVKNMGAFQLITTILKFIPIIFIATVGLLFIKGDNLAHLQPVRRVNILSAIMVLRWRSYCSPTSGSRLASVAAAKIKDPAKNVPEGHRLSGTIASGAVYLMSLIAVFGIVPNDVLASTDGTPSFSVALADILTGAPSGRATLMSAGFVVISGIGALNGWTMICAEMPLAASERGPVPGVLRQGQRQAGVPVFGASSCRRCWPRCSCSCPSLGTTGQ